MVDQTCKRALRFMLVTSAAVTAFIGATTVANAQEDDTDEGGRMIVTGSRIQRTDEGALPVQVITQEEIERTGATSAEQFLRTVSAAVQGNSNVVAASASGLNTGGVSSISLRGLGSQRTLVLVNGRRLSGGGTITDSVSVDVNSIPLAAIERVEVLKDGASAIYGSDAIAGVVNFILRDDFDGAELSLYGGGTDDGGAIKQATGAIGFGNLEEDRYNVMLAAGYHEEDALFGRDRSFSRTAIDEARLNDTTSGNTFPGNIFIPDAGEAALPGASGITRNPLAPDNCSPSVLSPLQPSNRCRFDPAPLVTLFPDSERTSVYSAGHWALTDSLQLYAEASYSRDKRRYVIQPVPLSDQFNLPPGHPLFNQAPYNRGAGLGGAPSGFAFSTVVITPSSPFYPTAYVQSQTGGDTPDLLVRYRAVENGNRDWTDTAEQPRAVVGIKSDMADWNFDAGVMYSETELTEHLNGGIPVYSQILPLLNSGQVNLFGPNTPEIQAQLRATNFIGDAYSSKTSITSFSAGGSRDLLKMASGSLALALGGEWRKEKFSTDPSLAMQIGDISHYGGNQLPQDWSRDVKALFAEVSVPIVRTLEANLALRFDDYENVGNKTTPKASLRWQPVEELLLRASYGKGFRAPSLTELYLPQTTGVTAQGISDPARCPTTGSSNDCATQFNVLLGGNPALDPEESDNYTLGVVFEPTPNASIGFDAFRVKLENPIIFGVDPTAIFTGESTQFVGFVTRGAATSDCPGCPGPVQQINQINLNLGATNVDGVDVDLRWRLPTTAFGTFSFGVIGTYFEKYEVQLPDGSFLSINGRASPIVQGNGGVIPRWHHYATVGWSSDAWEATVSQNFQNSYTDVLGTFEDPTDPAFTGPRTVASYQTFDIQAAFKGIERLKIALGLKNALDKDPPYSNAGGQAFFQSGYDPGYVDPRGRFWYANLAYSFNK